MPDENSTPVGTTQTVQDNQANTNDSGNDFVLDFGEDENISEDKDTNETGLDSLELNKENDIEGSETENNLQDNMDSNDLFGENITGNTEENSELNTKNQSIDSEKDDFTLQFEDRSDDKQEVNQEQTNEEMPMDGNILTENTENKLIDSSNELELEDMNINSQEKTETDDNNFFQELGEGTFGVGNERQDSGEILFDTQEEKAEEYSDFQAESNNDNVIEEKDDNIEKHDEVLGGGKKEDFDVGELKLEKNATDLENEIREINQYETNDDKENMEKDRSNSGINFDNDFLLENSNSIKEENIENTNEDFLKENYTDSQSEEINDAENTNSEEDYTNNKNNFFNEVDDENTVDNGSTNRDDFNLNDIFADNVQGNGQYDENINIQSDDEIKEESQNQNYFTEDFKEDNLSTDDNAQKTLNDSAITEAGQLQNNIFADDNSSNENLSSESVISKNNDTNDNQGQIENEINNKDENQNILQPDMKNLLGGEDVSFSFDVNEKEDKSSITENVQEMPQSIDDTTKNLLNGDVAEDNSQVNNLSGGQNLEERADTNSVSNDMDNEGKSLQNRVEVKNSEVPTSENLRDETGNTLKNSNEVNDAGSHSNSENQDVNKMNESETQNLNQEPQNNSELYNSTAKESETGVVKSTLSLDQLLDSELNSNPQFTDNSKSVSTNIEVKSGIFSGKKVAIFTGIFIFLLSGFVLSLAFPGLTEKLVGVINPTPIDTPDSPDTPDTPDSPDIPDTPETPDTPDTPDIPEIPDTPDTPYIEGQGTTTHGVGTKFETIDDNPDDSSSTGINPYNPTEIEEPDKNVPEKTAVISIDDIQSTISSFKSQGETYKNVGEEKLNEKVIKYASYVIRLCDDYQAQIDNGEGIDEDSFSLFQTKVLGFISKIETNLGGPDEVEIVYTKAGYDEDDEKKELRAHLENR